MSSQLPAMTYSAPLAEETFELDFKDLNDFKKSAVTSVRRKIRKKKEELQVDYSQWDSLPDLVLEDIFSRLSIRERYYASQVCSNWNRIFYSPRVWNTFILEDRTLTRRKFNYYMGDQYVLDHHRTQTCLNRIGRMFRRIIIKPMENYFNLYEFMTISSYFCEFFEDDALNLVRTLDFTFGCEFSGENSTESGAKIFGTGGKLLQALKRMMGNLTGLKHLSLQELLLDKEDAKYLLDDVAYNCCETLRTLKVVNCSKEAYGILHLGVFVNLQKLTISPQHLSEDVVMLIGYTQVQDLYLAQTRYTDHITPVSPKVWRQCAHRAPRLKVHHILESGAKTEVVCQEGAPVRSVVYDTPHLDVSTSSVVTISTAYYNTLQVYAHLGLPKRRIPVTFENRADNSLVLLVRSCYNLHTLVIRECLSTATLLLLVHFSKSLHRLVVRKNILIERCEWTQAMEWNDTFYSWLKSTSRSYDRTVEEISKTLGTKWAALTDEEFESFKL